MTSALPSIANHLTLQHLREQFHLVRVDDPAFFWEWQQDLPELSEFERTYLDQIKADFCSLEGEPLTEETVKMTVLAPLLSLARFFRKPFYPRAEVRVELAVEDESTIIRGRLDVLVIYQQLWVLAIETKRQELSLDAALAQALFYLLASPGSQPMTYGLLTNGKDFQFIKIERVNYDLSDKFTLERRVNELHLVLQILKHLGALMLPKTNGAIA
jgi:hypothetical protein